MKARKGAWIWLSVFWVSATLTLISAWETVDLFFIEPRSLQRELLGIKLDLSTLKAQYSAYAYDRSGPDIWTYELPTALGSQLAARCGRGQAMQFYDPQDNFRNNTPLKGCVVAERIDVSRGRTEEVVLSGNLLQFVRATQ